ncbi:hypothetical protein BYT27DRAFT_7218462 [Phlegmacium glaucopus]|nr:hypothetical protein BYT27DRAFT_7218462 [Phlegmacium glaucopus]
MYTPIHIAQALANLTKQLSAEITKFWQHVSPLQKTVPGDRLALATAILGIAGLLGILVESIRTWWGSVKFWKIGQDDGHCGSNERFEIIYFPNLEDPTTSVPLHQTRRSRSPYSK